MCVVESEREKLGDTIDDFNKSREFSAYGRGKC